MPEPPYLRMWDRWDWDDLPWAAKNLASPTREASLAALRDIATQLISIACGPTGELASKCVEDFMTNAERSPVLASVFHDRAVREIGPLLDNLARARAAAIHAHLCAEILAIRPELKKLKRFVAGLKEVQATSSILVGGDMHLKIVPEILKAAERNLEARKWMDNALRQPARWPKVESPSFWVAHGVDQFLGRKIKRADRDELAALLCREVLRLNTTTQRIERMMKRHRAKKLSPRADS